MKRMTLALAISAAALAGSSTPANADVCATGQAATCQQLSDCYALGAVPFLDTPPADLVGYYRGCLDLDRHFRLTPAGNGDQIRPRSRTLQTTGSTFWPLYCEARRRAGLAPDRICRLRPNGSSGRSGGGGNRGGSRGTPQPHFTGKVT